MQKIKIRWSDFPKCSSVILVISNITEGLIWNRRFIEFEAFFPFPKGKREFNIIFPAYPFRRAYIALPRSHRVKVGKKNVQVTICKTKRGKLSIDRLEKWHKEV